MVEFKLKGNRVQITITLKPEMAEKIAKIAEESGRTRSGLCSWLITEALEAKKLE